MEAENEHEIYVLENLFSFTRFQIPLNENCKKTLIHNIKK